MDREIVIATPVRQRAAHEAVLPFRSQLDFFRDIWQSIERIERFTSDMEIDVFSEDEKTISAVEREL